MTYNEARQISTGIQSFCGGEEYPWIYETIRTLPANKDGYVLEVGPYLGCGTVVMCAAVDERKKWDRDDLRVISVDTWCTGVPGTLQIQRESPRTDYLSLWMMHLRKAGFYGTLSIPMIGNSSNVLPFLAPNKCSFAWVDGDHEVEVYKDIPMTMKLMMVGGVIAMHDVSFMGAMEDVRKAIDANLKDNPSWKLIHEVSSLTTEWEAYERIA